MKRLFQKLGISAVTAGLFVPAIAQAQGLTDLQVFISSVGSIVDQLIPIVSGLALLGFFWGLAKYIFQADDEEEREDGKMMMVWAIVALFLIAAVGGIVEAIANTAGVDTGESINRTRIN